MLLAALLLPLTVTLSAGPAAAQGPRVSDAPAVPPVPPAAEPAAEPAAPQTPPPRAERPLPLALWASAGVFGASLVGGVVLGFLATDAQTDFDRRPTKALADRGERYAIYADVLFGLAAVAGLTGIVIYATEVEGDGGRAPDRLAARVPLGSRRVATEPPLRVAVEPRVSLHAAGALLRVSY